MKPNIGITPENLLKVTEILSAVLADGMVIYLKTRKFHWNVSGESFMEYHKLFEMHYTKLEEAIDEVAERISKLGSMAIGTTTEFSSMSQIKESPGKNPSSIEMVKELLNLVRYFLRLAPASIAASFYSNVHFSKMYCNGLKNRTTLLFWYININEI